MDKKVSGISIIANKEEEKYTDKKSKECSVPSRANPVTKKQTLQT